jgi:hypothetical protein
VRQDCPLSPALYVCVAEALLRFLQHKGIGVSVMGVRLTCTQFADDTQVFLPGPRHVPAFLEQRQQQQQGLQLPEFVISATVLGVEVGRFQASAVGNTLGGVRDVLKRLAHVQQLTAFGRGLGSAAYGVSKSLYAAEFSDAPSDLECRTLLASVAKLVDRGMAPDQPGRAFAGVPADLLQGRPADGGFGVLPWREHILARPGMHGGGPSL